MKNKCLDCKWWAMRNCLLFGEPISKNPDDVCDEWEARIERGSLQPKEERLIIALHDAIARPMGIVPASAEEFYNPKFYDKVE